MALNYLPNFLLLLQGSRFPLFHILKNELKNYTVFKTILFNNIYTNILLPVNNNIR